MSREMNYIQFLDNYDPKTLEEVREHIDLLIEQYGEEAEIELEIDVGPYGSAHSEWIIYSNE